MPHTLTFDHAQTRLARDMIVAFAGGDEMDGELFQDVWLDPIAHTLLKRPMCLYPEFWKNGAGMNARLPLSEFGLTSGTDGWVGHDVSFLGQNRILRPGGYGGTLVSTTTLPKNRGFYFGNYVFGQGHADDWLVSEIGWGADFASAAIGIRQFSSGTIEVYRSGAFVQAGQVGNLSGKFATLLLLPWRKKELLVFSPSHYEGFSVPFDDIDETATSPEISPASNVFVRHYGAVDFEIAPCRFKAAGCYGTSLRGELSLVPPAGATASSFPNPDWNGGGTRTFRIHGDGAYGPSGADTFVTASLVDHDGGAFAANGTDYAVRIKYELGGPAEYTPFVYGAMLAFDEATVETNDAEAYNATLSVRSLSLSVPESPSGVCFDVTLGNPAALAEHVAKLTQVTNRPVRLDFDGSLAVDGRSEMPDTDGQAVDEAETTRLSVRDAWKALENFRFLSPIVLDGYELSAALALILRSAGIPVSRHALEVTSVILGDVAARQAGTFSLVIQEGDAAADWVTQLVEDNAAGWFYGFVPIGAQTKFRFASPDTLAAQSPVGKVYLTTEAAVADGVDPDDATNHVVRKIRHSPLEPLANDVRVRGYDPRTGRGVEVYDFDAASQNPALTPSARPDNWVGERRRNWLPMGSGSAELGAEIAAYALAKDSAAPFVVEIECEMVKTPYGNPAWRGHTLDVVGYGVVLIETLHVDVELDMGAEETDAHSLRPTTYTATLIAPDVPPEPED